MSEAALRTAILALTRERGPDKTICPSEAARSVAGEGGDWRDLMEQTRGVAAILAAEGSIDVTQGGVPVDISTARGPIRLRRRI